MDRRRVIVQLRRYFVTGVLSLLPTIVVVYILWFLIGKLKGATDWVFDLFPTLTGFWAEFLFPVVFLLLAASLIIIMGVASRSLAGRGIVRLWERLITGIPVLSRVYVGVKQIIAALSLQRKQPFKGVVLVQYPREGMYRIGLITADGLDGFLPDEELLAVFVPSTPNPMGGFLFLVAKRDVIPIKMPVEEAIKMVVSAGFVTPNFVRQATTGKIPNGVLPVADGGNAEASGDSSRPSSVR